MAEFPKMSTIEASASTLEMTPMPHIHHSGTPAVSREDILIENSSLLVHRRSRGRVDWLSRHERAKTSGRNVMRPQNQLQGG
jgi:hypothetical protein